MKKPRLFASFMDIVFVVVAICSFPCMAFGQTIVSHDLAGNRSAEVSNQPITAPVITGQPQGLLGQVGGTYTFTVAASGANLSYQWYKDSTAISGATSDTLVITNALLSDFSNHTTTTGMYSVVVSNTAGSVNSNSVALYMDTNGVGVPDWWQVLYFGSITGFNPGAAPWGNGITNLQAYQDGLNPTSATTEGYSLTTSGPVKVDPHQPSYTSGSSVTLSVPNGLLQNWAGDAVGGANPLTVYMTRSKSIQAVVTDFVNAHFGATLTAPGATSVTSLLVQASGQIMVGGYFTTFLGRPQWGLGQINADGTLNTDFFPGSKSTFLSLGGGTTVVYDMAQQPDGKVIVVGNFSQPVLSGFAPPQYIYRYNIDGTFDATFMANGQSPNGEVNAVAVQSDGKVLIAGNFSSIGTTSVQGMARLNSDGSLDTSFTAASGLTGVVNAGCLRVDPSGNIYLGGSFTNYGSTSVSRLVRLTGTGALDTTFSTGTGFDAAVSCLALRSGGGLYVGGDFTHYQGTAANNMVALTNGGAIDTTFNPGSGTSSEASQIIILPSNQMLVVLPSAMWQGSHTGFVIRLNSSGSVDTSFAPIFDQAVYKIGLESSGKIVAGGNFLTVNGQPRSKLVQLNADGTLDTPIYNVGTGFYNTSDVAAVQADGKLLIDGNFTQVGNTSISNTVSCNLVRLNTDGTLDSTFSPGMGANVANGIIPLASGKTILYGYLYSYNGIFVGGCIQINSDGTLDTTFGNNAGTTVNAAAIQSTGNIVVAKSTSPYLARLTPTGAVDSTFNPAAVNQPVRAIAVDAMDRILIGGDFTTVAGASMGYFARLNSDGSLDTTFTPSAPNNTVNQIALSPNGQIITRGVFTTAGSTPQAGLARYSSSGVLDPIPGQNVPGGATTLAVQSDGGIVLGGNYSPSSAALFRLTPGGTPDLAFTPATDNGVNAVVIGSNDDIYAIGSFTTDASEYASGIARYSASPHLNLAFTGIVPTGAVTAGTPVTLYGSVSTSSGNLANVDFLYSTDGVNYLPASSGISLGSGVWTGIWAPPVAGTYYLRLAATDTTGESGHSPVFAYTATSGSPVISAPTLSVSSGTYSGAQFVDVSDSTPGVQVFYTLDGSDPATSSMRILLGTGGLIPIWQTGSLKVEAIYGSGASSLVSYSYTINSSLSAVPTGAPSYYPQWWFTRGVIKQTGTPVSSPTWPTNYPAADDFAVINQGQLKNLANLAYDELASVLPPTAWSTPQGQTLTSLVSSLSPTGGDAYTAVNLGQLKTVAQPFYDLLKEQSMTTSYPWTGSGADNYSVTNIGQAKNVFNSTIP